MLFQNEVHLINEYKHPKHLKNGKKYNLSAQWCRSKYNKTTFEKKGAGYTQVILFCNLPGTSSSSSFSSAD